MSKNIFKRIQIALGLVQKMSEATLVSGDVISWEDDLVEGTEIFLLSEDEGVVTAPDGEYVIDDGTKIIVQEGVATEVVVVEELENETSEDEEEMVEEEMETEEVETEDVVQTSYEDLVFRLNVMEEKIEELSKSLMLSVQQNLKLSAKVTKLSEEPAIETVTKRSSLLQDPEENAFLKLKRKK